MDLGLEGRTAVVTGVSRGIGWATARVLLEEGANVVGVSRTPVDEDLDGLVHVTGDVTDEKTPERVVATALSEFGRLDVLVNNAGKGILRGGYGSVTAQQWRSTWELLFLSAVQMTTAALPALTEASGVVVNIVTRNARVPVAAVPDYSAAKAALLNYSKGLAREYASRGLRVVSVSPGPVATPLWLGPGGAAEQVAALDGTAPEDAIRETEQAMPHGRFVTAAEVADLVAYLVSARAGSVGGVDILIDAGLTQTI